MKRGRAFLVVFLAAVCAQHVLCSESDTDAYISGDDIVAQLMELAVMSDHPSPAVTRVLYTAADLKARVFVKSLMRDAGLDVEEDAIGNIFGTLPGSDESAPYVLTGSHTDAIPRAGAYDGTVGVLGGIAALRALRQAGFVPARSLRVVMFASEEPTRFGLSCLGSRALAGELSAGALLALRDENGTTFFDAAHAAGYAGGYDSTEPSAERFLEALALPPGSVHAFVELHIEQGPLLEAQGVPLGVVSAIAAPATVEIVFRGPGGHAGGLLMPARRDPSLAAAEASLALEALALERGGADTVATTGAWRVSPNAINAVPVEAVLTMDVRDATLRRRDAVVEGILVAAEGIARRRKVELSTRILNRDAPATCDLAVVAALERAAADAGLRTLSLVSRAYHDALFMARVAPMGMLFVPCRNGWSHRPDEFASPADVRDGVRVLAQTLRALAGPQAEHEEL